MTSGGNGERWCRRHRFACDVVFAVVVAAVDTGMTLVGLSWWPDRPGVLAWVLLGVQAAACLSLVARRRAPLAVVTALGGFTLVLTLLVSPAHLLTPAHGTNLWAPFGTVVAAYGPVFYLTPRRRSYLVLAALTLVVTRPWDPSFGVIAIGLTRTAVGPLLALYFDTRRRLVQALRERAERAERERHLLAERARAEERARLAGEMHDVVTHRVSLMVLQAGALRLTSTDDATRQVAEELRAAGCQALAELRDLVGILRTAPEGDGSPTQPIAVLVEESTAVGVPTELVEEGDRALASPVVERTVYRIVREALTNVRKHAPGARVTVRVVYGETRVRLTVHNTAPTGTPNRALAGTGSGLGIVTLRQRLELVHGTLRAGHAPDGGFNVEATLPAYVPTVEQAA
jgi:signal transduction histidine kinase